MVELLLYLHILQLFLLLVQNLSFFENFHGQISDFLVLLLAFLKQSFDQSSTDSQALNPLRHVHGDQERAVAELDLGRSIECDSANQLVAVPRADGESGVGLSRELIANLVDSLFGEGLRVLAERERLGHQHFLSQGLVRLRVVRGHDSDVHTVL